jgi:hypothetical protein
MLSVAGHFHVHDPSVPGLQILLELPYPANIAKLGITHVIGQS